ncbi:hypothetical protein Cadr_000022471 [Camelus dromedarius]|uniref:Uncharacterized protein n=1 Tax=Camelus dromedarius TaxID=9838 RepID=A0A5N4CRC0_CAMDR|nr:hypothetical protein Cadr_000022471 [Camelus dromedarius]
MLSSEMRENPRCDSRQLIAGSICQTGAEKRSSSPEQRPAGPREMSTEHRVLGLETRPAQAWFEGLEMHTDLVKAK